MGCAAFHLLPQLNGGLSFGLSNATTNAQPRVRFNGGTPPIFSGFIGGYSVFSASLRPT